MAIRTAKRTEVRVVLPWPPSINGYWRSTERMVRGRRIQAQIISEEGRVYRAAAIAAIFEQGRPVVEGTVRLKEYFYPPTNQKRDIDNFRKAPRDALVHAGVLEDDSRIREDMGFMLEADPKRPRIEYVIERLGGMA